uniref:Uncharacterized protein n=1 Tax=Janibacter limosus TaxID=53458 RepID=A0AC61U139_9MICO|nr:hypothetical protein [Janibacter limosus]
MVDERVEELARPGDDTDLRIAVLRYSRGGRLRRGPSLCQRRRAAGRVGRPPGVARHRCRHAW